MSAAATAAGYLYASGRLRGRQAKEHEQEQNHKQPEAPKAQREVQREEVRVAAMPSGQDARPRRQPTIQYRTRRWRPDDANKPE